LYPPLLALCCNLDVCAVQSDSDVMTSGLPIFIWVGTAHKIDRQDAAEYDRHLSSLYCSIFPSDRQLVIECSWWASKFLVCLYRANCFDVKLSL